jgi:hypothetical protein
MKKRILSLAVILVLAFSLVPGVAAQSDGCFQLSADDCALLNAATSNTNTITSFNHRIVIDFSLSGLSDLDVPDITASAAGGGALVIVPGAEVPVLVRIDLDANVVEGAETIFSGPVVFALTEDYLYFPLDDELVGVPLTEEVLAQLDFDDLTGGLAGSIEPGMSDVTSLGDLFDFGDDDMGLDGTDELVMAYVNLSRLNDAQVMGETMHPFRFAFDVGAFLNSDEFMEVIGMLAMFGMSEQEELQEMMMFLPMFFQDLESELALTRYVGAADNYVRKLTLEFGLSMNLGMLFGDPTMDPVVVNLLLDVEMSDINQVTTVAAPEGARLLSPEEANQLMGQ